VAKAYKELEIQSILETHQGTGTFISGDVKIQLPAKERQNKLKEICNEFSSIAFSYGFSIDDIINQLKKQK
jgi:GntR family transcriptional regulator